MMNDTFLFIYDIFRFGFFAVFVGLHAALMAGLVLEWSRDKRARGAGSPEPFVSVIIPIHNEEHRMAGMLRSLSRQEYANAEFIFVDDRSIDNSASILRDFFANQTNAPGNSAPEASLPKMRVLSLVENPGPNYKQFALEKGIECSRGEFILFTDADCEIPPRWIPSMLRSMTDPKVGASLGPVFKKSGGKGFFHLYLAASTGIGSAGGGFGNNLIVRRECLDAIGGYRSVPPSATEDAALISRIRSHSDYKVRAGLANDTHIMTEAESGWKEFVTQTLRWNNGGLFSPDLTTRFNFGFLMITISMGILAIPLLPFIPSLWPLTGAVMISMAANTIATLGLFGASLPQKGAAYIVQCVFTPMYFTFLTLLGLCGIKPMWKGKIIG